MAQVLGINSDYLYFLVGALPPDIRCRQLTKAQVIKAYTAFRNALE